MKPTGPRGCGVLQIRVIPPWEAGRGNWSWPRVVAGPPAIDRWSRAGDSEEYVALRRSATRPAMEPAWEYAPSRKGDILQGL
jgi:hypothetical protein